ncbi:MAG: hypothetical protein LUC19_02640 [Oscillospiraceae bacterium]|nr:hypothetical protein [Oscillospiraceae bacterium]MCD8373830.1 hypothetical protein [Oscillospiraceae bacterium]
MSLIDDDREYEDLEQIEYLKKWKQERDARKEHKERCLTEIKQSFRSARYWAGEYLKRK